jgi:hypothetical protein
MGFMHDYFVFLGTQNKKKMYMLLQDELIYQKKTLSMAHSQCALLNKIKPLAHDRTSKMV